MAPRSFARIGEVLPAVLRDLGLQTKFNERQVVEKWATVVGPELARRARALRCDNGTLVVHVDHGAWMQEMHFIEKDLLSKLRAACPDVNLLRIRLTARDTDLPPTGIGRRDEK
jgi:predicted nucleic acid-binding Zn ribbon protein